MPFEIDDAKGPLLDSPVRDAAALARLHDIDLSRLEFVGDSLRTLRAEVGNTAAVLGFVGSPWTLATYVVEGASSSTYKTIKTMMYSAPDILHGLLAKLADAVAAYACYQAASGAQCIQLFDSWGGQLPPAVGGERMWVGLGGRGGEGMGWVEGVA